MLRGRIDHALTDEGWQQMYQSCGISAQDTQQKVRWTQVFSSPLQRCRKFAEQVSQRFRLPLAVEAHWQEIDYGDWDGMPLTQWRKTAAPQFREFRKDMAALTPPDGENFLLFRDRVLSAWQQLARLPDGSHGLLVTHGGVMRVILPTVLGIPLNNTASLHIPFACLSRVEIDSSADVQRYTLQFHNATLTP